MGFIKFPIKVPEQRSKSLTAAFELKVHPVQIVVPPDW